MFRLLPVNIYPPDDLYSALKKTNMFKKFIKLFFILQVWLSLSFCAESNPPPTVRLPITEDLDRQIQQSTEKLRSEIERAGKEIQMQLKGPSSNDQDVHVILAPYHRTILSNQISTPILSSQVSSIVEKIYKRMGEYFEKDELLIKINDDIFIANLEKALASVDRARALLNTRKALYKDNIISYLELKEAEAAAASAEAEYVLAKTQYDGAFVTAPYAGRVIALMIEEYELPQPGQALIEIEQVDRLLAKIFFPSSYYQELTIGRILNIHIKETNSNIQATIIRVGGTIDPSSSTIAVDAEIDNSKRELLPGMTGTTNTKELTSEEEKTNS